MFFITTILASLFLAKTAKADLGKASDYPDGLSPHFVFGSLLPFPGGSYVGVALPAQCASYAASKHSDGSLYCNAADMTAVNVTYGDCAQPWTACYCNEQRESYMSLNDFLVNYGRLPVNLRDYVRFISAFPDTGASAFTELPINDIVLFADESTEAGLTVYIHESGHAIDDLQVSESSAWLNAIAADSCVPDGYADTNEVEDFAQVNVVSLYIDRAGGPPSGSSVSCMQNQLNVFSSNSRINRAAMALATCDTSVRASKNHLKRATATRKAIWPTDAATREEAKTAQFNAFVDYGHAEAEIQRPIDTTVHTLTAKAGIPTTPVKSRIYGKYRT